MKKPYFSDDMSETVEYFHQIINRWFDGRKELAIPRVFRRVSSYDFPFFLCFVFFSPDNFQRVVSRYRDETIERTVYYASSSFIYLLFFFCPRDTVANQKRRRRRRRDDQSIVFPMAFFLLVRISSFALLYKGHDFLKNSRWSGEKKNHYTHNRSFLVLCGYISRWLCIIHFMCAFGTTNFPHVYIYM